jgi:hypothetical protein
MLHLLIAKVRAWYGGKWESYEAPQDSAVVFINAGNYKLHWTAEATRVLVRFWAAHWKWIVTTALAVAALLLRVEGKV